MPLQNVRRVSSHPPFASRRPRTTQGLSAPHNHHRPMEGLMVRELNLGTQTGGCADGASLSVESGDLRCAGWMDRTIGRGLTTAFVRPRASKGGGSFQRRSLRLVDRPASRPSAHRRQAGRFSRLPCCPEFLCSSLAYRREPLIPGRSGSPFNVLPAPKIRVEHEGRSFASPHREGVSKPTTSKGETSWHAKKPTRTCP